MNTDIMHFRCRLFQETRDFFYSQGFLEVDTPLLSPSLIPEGPITPFKTTFLHPYGQRRKLYLIPSPELWMKRLISEGSPSIFQICRSFRNGEAVGAQHNPEFSMLEYYAIEKNYEDSMKLTERFISHLIKNLQLEREEFEKPFRKISIEEITHEYAGASLESLQKTDKFKSFLNKKGIRTEPGDNWPDLFDRLFVTLIEPNIPNDQPIFLYDYPSKVPVLAKKIPGTPWCERWELYYRGIELANCYTEEDNPDRISDFYQHEIKRKKGELLAPPDKEFLNIFSSPFPLCSGTALGMDRLMMVLLGQSDIKGVIFFPFSDIL